MKNFYATKPPFTNLTQKALRWNEYYSYLNAQIDQPLFSENFSLRQIYIPLRAKTDKPITYNNSDNKGEILDLFHKSKNDLLFG